MSDLFDDYFSSTRVVPVHLTDLEAVGQDVIQYFRAREYTVSGTRMPSGGYYISLHKGDWFRSILGLKTALNITIEPVVEGTFVKAGIGIFELQVIPTIITIFVFAPIVLAQIWGIIQQEKLDEEAVQYVEDRLHVYGGPYGASPSHSAARAAAEAELRGD